MTSRSKPPVLLTIAGFDPGSGAGITADIQVFAVHGMWGTACPTALTVQSTLGVSRVEPVDAGLLRDMLEKVCADLPPAAIKIGMLGSEAAVLAIAAFIRENRISCPVVVDPVMRSSSGAELLSAAGQQAFERELLPLATWMTPNAAELSTLTDLPVSSWLEVESAFRRAAELWPELHIVCTGGDFAPQGADQVTDVLLMPGGAIRRFSGERVRTTSTHGTGCAFSSALACQLARGASASDAVRGAKHYVGEALRRAPGLGSGHGPLALLWPLQAES